MGLSWQMAAGAGMVPHPSCAYGVSAVEWESVWERIHPARVFPRVCHAPKCKDARTVSDFATNTASPPQACRRQRIFPLSSHSTHNSPYQIPTEWSRNRTHTTLMVNLPLQSGLRKALNVSSASHTVESEMVTLWGHRRHRLRLICTTYHCVWWLELNGFAWFAYFSA
jgi:hypothetical protein